MLSDQKKFWLKEFERKSIFPGIHKTSPTSSVKDFEKKFLIDKSYKVLDLGTGNGRNAIYLSELGHNVIAVDFIDSAFQKAKEKYPFINFRAMDIGKPWKALRDNTFDAVLDVNATICIPEKGRINAIEETYRVLKDGGYYLFCGIERTEWVDKEPGPEVNSTIFSDSGKFEKQYTKEELLETYKNFKLVDLVSKKVSSRINNEEIDFGVISAVFRKE